MIRLLCAVLFLSRVVSAAVDACAVVPSVDIASMLGTTKNKGITDKLKLPPKATEGKVCTYVGKDNSATVIWIKFPSAAAAREYLKNVRDDFTVISGLSHPNTRGGGHKAEAVMLTGAPYPDYSYNLRNTAKRK